MCLMTMTGPVSPGRPGARPGSARCPGPTRPRRCASSPGSSPTSRTCPSCRTAGPAPTSPAAPPRCWSRSRSRSRRAAGGWPNGPAATWPGPGPCSPPTWTSWRRCSTASAGRSRSSCAGPWTLAATLELPRTLNVAIADPGAVADLTASLAEGAAAHVAEIAKRVPGAQLVVQFDEPPCPPWPGARCRRRAGCRGCAPVEADVAAGAAGPGDRQHREVHGGAQLRSTAVPFGIIRAAGAGALSFDLSQLRRGEEDAVAEAAEAGLGLLTGVVPAVPAPGPAPRPARAEAGRTEPRATAAPRPGRRPNGSSGCGSGWGCRWTRCPEQAVITPGLRAGRRVPRSGARRVDALPRGGEHAG